MRNDKFWDECNNNSIRQDVAKFIDSSPILQKFKGVVYYQLEDALVQFIEDIKQKIYEEVEKEYKRDDVYSKVCEEENSSEEKIANVIPFEYIDQLIDIWIEGLANRDGYWQEYWDSLGDALRDEKWKVGIRELSEEESWIYAAYLKQWFSEHDFKCEAPVCADEFFNNEMKDNGLAEHYKRLAKALQEAENQSNI